MEIKTSGPKTKTSKTKIRNPNAIMNEGPTIVGMMSAIIERGGSIDSAVRDVAKNGPKRSASLFRSIAVRADTRQIPDISHGLSEMLTSLPAEATAYRRSVHMVMVAAASPDQSERKRMLSDASDISLTGLKEIGENYSTSLNVPCMMIFGLGIMVPMVLMSILPMLSLGGVFGNSSSSIGPIVLVTVVVIPAIIMSLIFSVKEKNPFMRPVSNMDPKYILPALSAAPAALAVFVLTNDLQMSLMIAAVVSGIAMLAYVFPYVRSESVREKQEMLLQDAVFELGNRLIAGENFETAIVKAVGMRAECSAIAESISREMAVCRGDACAAIKASVGKVSVRISDVFCDVYRCSLKDVRDAGRLAVSIGRQIQDQDTVRKGIKNKLKSMTDMMTGTAAVFAPLVLGMSVTMLEPVSRVMEGADLGGTSQILSVYLIELCILIAVLTSFLNGKTDIMYMTYRMGIILPVSMAVFTMCSAIGL
ncbi:MAG: hypothetical protein LBH88_02380 [Candidatus Methanoplasma sp.]|jgi:hypothetical protein|nr:hypothetical protein [Candidatus Methanoplasma sp.]